MIARSALQSNEYTFKFIPAAIKRIIYHYLWAIDLGNCYCVTSNFFNISQLLAVIQQRLSDHSITVQLCEPNIQLLTWLKRVHLIESYSFDFRFSLEKKAPHIWILDKERRQAKWLQEYGSIYGDTRCQSSLVSYWEVTGVSNCTFIGIAELIQLDELEASGLRLGYIYSSSKYLEYSPGCDYVPGIMYSSVGYITNGSFRGPKPILPGKILKIPAEKYDQDDRIGVFVDLLEGIPVFFRNGILQAIPIPINPLKQYYPIFSNSTSPLMIIHTKNSPPWKTIYSQI